MNIYKEYIYDHINDLHITNKKELLKIIIDENFNISTVSEKGSGCQLKFDSFSDKKIEDIYRFIKNIIDNTYSPVSLWLRRA